MDHLRIISIATSGQNLPSEYSQQLIISQYTTVSVPSDNPVLEVGADSRNDAPYPNETWSRLALVIIAKNKVTHELFMLMLRDSGIPPLSADYTYGQKLLKQCGDQLIAWMRFGKVFHEMRQNGGRIRGAYKAINITRVGLYVLMHSLGVDAKDVRASMPRPEELFENSKLDYLFQEVRTLVEKYTKP